MMSPALLLIWIPVIVVAAILVPGALVLGAAVGIDAAVRQHPVERPRAEGTTPSVRPELPRQAA
jgi:hypothetical protein